MKRSSIATAFAVIGLMAAASSSHADELRTRSKIVHLARLDLRTPAGQAALRHRVHLAARAVCGPAEGFNTPEGDSFDRCVRMAEQPAMQRAEALIAARSTTLRLAST